MFSTVGDIQYHGGYYDKCGDIFSTVGVFSTVGILSTVEGYHDARGGYHAYHMGVKYREGKIFCYLSTPWD